MGRERRFAGAIVVWVVALCVLAGWSELRSQTPKGSDEPVAFAMLVAP